MRVIILEDNTATLFLLKRILRITDAEVKNFPRAEQAIKVLPDFPPDLALVDIQLAGQLTGLDFIRTIRESGSTIPIVAMTAYALEGERQKCIDAGCNEYVAKPFRVGRLTEILETYLSPGQTK